MYIHLLVQDRKDKVEFNIYCVCLYRIGRTGRAGKTGTAYTFFQTCDKARAGELVKVRDYSV